MPPPSSSEGGPIAGLFYALYYPAPLAILGLGLRSGARWIRALVGLFALALVMPHSAPLMTLQRPFEEMPWQQIVGLMLSVLCGLAEALIFVLVVASLVPGVFHSHRGI